MERTFLVLGAVFGLVGVALGAFGSHALRAKLPPERVATFETGVRYQMWHALALFVVVVVGGVRIADAGLSSAYLIAEGTTEWPAAVAGWLFVVGVVLFSGSLYALAFTGRRSLGAITPIGGLCLLGGWALLILAAATA